jgi:hypothetical protein
VRSALHPRAPSARPPCLASVIPRGVLVSKSPSTSPVLRGDVIAPTAANSSNGGSAAEEREGFDLRDARDGVFARHNTFDEACARTGPAPAPEVPAPAPEAPAPAPYTLHSNGRQSTSTDKSRRTHGVM